MKQSRYIKEKKSNLGNELMANVPILLINFGIYNDGTLFKINNQKLLDVLTHIIVTSLILYTLSQMVVFIAC